MTHKISLYANYVILYITYPLNSIPVLLSCLVEFGEISGYKVNETKSEVLMLVGKWPNELDKEVTFNWSNRGFRYLGIMITTQTKQLFNENYGRLITQIKSDLTQWEILPLSLIGRIKTVRMNILPRLSYLFQSLPIWILATKFRMLDKMISAFIWQKRKPRIRQKLLLSPKEKGSLSLPSLKLYYWAAQLGSMLEWLVQDEDTNWIGLENHACLLVPLEMMPFMEQKKWRDLNIENEWIICTHRVWSLVRKKIGAPLTISRAVKIPKIVDFLPNKLDAGFQIWANKGLITINQMFVGETLKSFKQLQDKYGLCSKDFYWYLQLRDYLLSHIEYNALKQQASPLENLLVKCIEENSKKKSASNIYKHLRTHFSGNSLDIKQKWELEMNVIEDEEWEVVCEQGHKVTHSPVWKEFNWKFKIRYFKAPSVTSKYDKNNSYLCWRKCKQIGDHTHIFWDCPILIPF